MVKSYLLKIFRASMVGILSRKFDQHIVGDTIGSSLKMNIISKNRYILQRNCAFFNDNFHQTEKNCELASIDTFKNYQRLE